MTRRLRPCIDCGVLTYDTRCRPHYLAQQRARNRTPERRALYRTGNWTARSRAARAAQPWCSTCGATDQLALDHQHGQVECVRCNNAHRRPPC